MNKLKELLTLQKLHDLYNAHNVERYGFCCKECLKIEKRFGIEEYLAVAYKKGLFNEMLEFICKTNKIKKEKVLKELSKINIIPVTGERLFYYKGGIYHIRIKDIIGENKAIRINGKEYEREWICIEEFEKIVKEECEKIRRENARKSNCNK